MPDSRLQACAVGCKRWAFVHPGCAPDATIRGVKDGAPSLAASDWFEHVLPGLAAAHPGSVHEFLQPAGTLVYFPPAVRQLRHYFGLDHLSRMSRLCNTARAAPWWYMPCSSSDAFQGAPNYFIIIIWAWC